MLNKEQLEALTKLGKQFEGVIAKLAKEQGQTDGTPNADAIQKDQMEKMKKDILDEIHKVVPVKKKMVFDSKKKDNLGVDEHYCSIAEFMLKAKYNHPDLADRYMKDFVKTSMSEGTPAQGGYTVPVEYASEILGLLNDLPTILQKVTKMTQSAPTRNLPKWLTDMIIYWVGEGSLKTSSKPTLQQKQLILKKVCALTPMTDEYIQDDISGMPGLLSKLVAENIGVELERIILVGSTGLGDPFNGIYYSAGINTVGQLGANLTYQDVLNCYNNANVLERYRVNPEWYLNRRSLGLIMGLVDGNNRPLWSIGNAYAKIPPTIFDAPYNTSSQVPNNIGTGATSTAIIFGDYRNVIVSSKTGMAEIVLTISNQGVISNGSGVVTTNLFQQDETAYRWVARKAVLVANPEAYSVLQNVR